MSEESPKRASFGPRPRDTVCWIVGTKLYPVFNQHCFRRALAARRVHISRTNVRIKPRAANVFSYAHGAGLRLADGSSRTVGPGVRRTARGSACTVDGRNVYRVRATGRVDRRLDDDGGGGGSRSLFGGNRQANICARGKRDRRLL